MDLAIGFFLGFFALPWMWMSLLIFLFACDVLMLEDERFGWASFSLIGGIGTVAYFGAAVNPFTWAWVNLAEIAQFLGIYFVLGAAWSTFKWHNFSTKGAARLQKRIEDWRARKALNESSQEGRAHRSNYDSGYQTEPQRPDESFAKNSKARLMGWVVHWPFSMIGFVIGDMLTWVAETIFDLLKGFYNRIADSAYAKVDNDR